MFRARGCTPEEAADLAQEAAVRAFIHIRRWGVTSSGLDPLLNRIARNLLIDRYRRTTPHIVPLDDAGELHDPAQDPTEEVDRRQRRSAVQSAIRALPVRHRTAINYSLSGLSPEEVGVRMGIGRNAADALLHRARRSLKEHLTTAGEGMFGFALAIRVRWDRLVRRAGIQWNVTDASIAAASSAVSVATAAIIAVLSVTGGGATSTPSVSNLAFAGLQNEDKAALVVEAVDSTIASPPSAGGTTPVHTVRVGPSRTSWSPGNGIDNSTDVPDPGNPSGPPILNIYQRIWNNDGGRQPLDPKVNLSPILCDFGPPGC